MEKTSPAFFVIYIQLYTTQLDRSSYRTRASSPRKNTQTPTLCLKISWMNSTLRAAMRIVSCAQMEFPRNEIKWWNRRSHKYKFNCRIHHSRNVDIKCRYPNYSRKRFSAWFQMATSPVVNPTQDISSKHEWFRSILKLETHNQRHHWCRHRSNLVQPHLIVFRWLSFRVKSEIKREMGNIINS